MHVYISGMNILKPPDASFSRKIEKTDFASHARGYFGLIHFYRRLYMNRCEHESQKQSYGWF